eukprot:7905092-Lingulodinium_polyedra.AAC.1
MAARVTLRATRRRARVLHAAAEPGPSGGRNSHIQIVADASGGAEALTAWCQLWIEGAMGAAETRLWSGGVVIP